MLANWGYHIRKLREVHRLTQAELANRSGLKRSHISRIEKGAYQSCKQDTFGRLARGLSMTTSNLSQEIYGISIPRQETSEDILERLRLAHPVSVPVYTEFPFHAGEPVEPVDYVYRARTRATRMNIEAYIVRGKCLEPIIQDQDIIVVDREGQIDTGGIVACLFQDTLHLGCLRKIADDLYLENNEGRIKFQECQVAAPVIEVIRRLK